MHSFPNFTPPSQVCTGTSLVCGRPSEETQIYKCQPINCSRTTLTVMWPSPAVLLQFQLWFTNVFKSKKMRLIDTYFSAWNAADAPTITERLTACLSPASFAYQDPQYQTTDLMDLARHIAEFKKTFPGPIALISSIDQYGSVARCIWQIRQPNGSIIMDGTDFFQFDEAGRLRSITGFFGRL